MRFIAIGLNTAIAIDDADATALDAEDIIYPCGDPGHDHDYHLNPEREFTLEDVERLLTAAHKAQTLPQGTGPGIHRLTMSAILAREIIENLGDEAKVKQRGEYIVRNLALNAAQNLLKKGFFSVSSEEVPQGLSFRSDITVVEPGLTFPVAAKQWLLALIEKNSDLDPETKAVVLKAVRDAV